MTNTVVNGVCNGVTNVVSNAARTAVQNQNQNQSLCYVWFVVVGLISKSNLTSSSAHRFGLGGIG